MQPKHRALGVAAGLLAAGLIWGDARAQVALTGLVSAPDEGPMEGVLVSAKKEGSTITTTVVSDQQGAFSFPSARLEPGKYTISIRAIGYRLDGAKTADVPASGEGRAELKLSKVKSLVPQLSNGEWLLSLPGADKQKAFLTMCVGCHTLQRVLTSNHDAAEFQQVFLRMARYSPGSTPTHPQPLLPGPRGERPVVTGDAAKAAAEFLASVTLGNSEAIEYPLKALPRPKGRSTKVVITEYDLPRKDALPHDVVVDKDGQVWYSDFGAQFVGVMDPKTGKTKDIAIPVVRPEQPKGGLDLEFDPDGNIWLAMMYQAGISKIDRKTHEVSVFPFPKEWISTSAQASMVSPMYSNVEQPLSTGVRRPEHRSPRRQDARGHDLADRDGAVAAAARARRRAEPPVVRRVWRQWHRHVRSEDRHHQGVATSHALERALRRGRDQERCRSLDRLDADRPSVAARYRNRRGRGLSSAAHDQYPARVRRRDGRAAGAVGRQQSRRRHYQGGTAGLTCRYGCGAPRCGAMAPFLGDGKMIGAQGGSGLAWSMVFSGASSASAKGVPGCHPQAIGRCPMPSSPSRRTMPTTSRGR
jgi:hypothetical protein